MFFLQGILVDCFGQNLPLWSLSYEFWFYMIFPCMVLAFTSPRWLYKIFYGTLALAMSFFVGHGMIWYLVWLLGVLVFMAPRKKLFQKNAILIGLVIFMCSLIARKIIAPVNEWDVFANYVVGIGFACFVYLLVCDKDSDTSPVPGVHWIKIFAGMSYTVYLIHFPMIYVICMVPPGGRFSRGAQWITIGLCGQWNDPLHRLGVGPVDRGAYGPR